MLERLAGADRLTLLTDPAPLPAAAEATLDDWVARRAAGEPLQHLTGVAPFWGLELRAGPAALVPRPETERLVELALDALRPLRAPVVLDVGTGSGAIAVAISRERTDAAVWATDVDADALALAAANVREAAPAVRLVRADLLDGPELAPVLPRVDLLVSNPPYLPDGDRANLPREVRRDPPGALFGGPDGLAPFRRLLAQAGERLPARAPLLLELDPRNVELAAAHARATGRSARVHADLAGRARFLEVRGRSSPPGPADAS